MKTRRGSLRKFNSGWLGAVMALALLLPSGARAGDPARSAELFDQAAAELDLHGDMFVYFQIENLVEGLLGKFKAAMERVAQQDDSAAEAADVFRRLDAFLRGQGLYDGVSVGLSSKPRPDGLFEVKSFIGRRPAENEPLFWRMLGGAPRALRVLDLLPADAALVVSADIQPADIWAFLQAAVREVGSEQAHEEMRAAVDELKTSAGADLDALLASLSGELAVSVQLSKEKTLPLPLGEEGIEVPEPSLLIAIGVKDDSLMQLLLTLLGGSGLTFEEQQTGGATLHVSPAVAEAPFPLQPALAQHEGFLLAGSTPDVLAQAVAVLGGAPGLKAEAGFQALTQGLPAEHNGLTFIDERLKAAAYEIQRGAIRGDMDEEEAELTLELMDLFFGWSMKGSVASVRVVKPTGLLTHSVTPTGGREVLLLGAAMPAGMLAAITIPSFTRARSHAQHAQMINTLRLVDAAKQQWALEESKNDGEEVTEADIEPYLRPGSLALPPGHTLTINPLGEDPVITRPDGTQITLP
ncbi:MAG: hypothetical protein KA248_00220 [Kiritimatiellae bacterium]|nr:hypothetical protein [Kiritimatiellia bacterium]